jgi:hypothetical protein
MCVLGPCHVNEVRTARTNVCVLQTSTNRVVWREGEERRTIRFSDGGLVDRKLERNTASPHFSYIFDQAG